MKITEEIELVEAKGKDGEIETAEVAMHFSDENGNTVTNYSSGRLAASISADSDEDIIIHSVLNSMGAGKLNDVRNEARKRLKEIGGEDEVYYTAKNETIRKVFIKMAALQLGYWDTMEAYFNSEDRTPLERLFFTDAIEWRKNNPILRDSLGNPSDEDVEKIYNLAHELNKKEKKDDIFLR